MFAKCMTKHKHIYSPFSISKARSAETCVLTCTFLGLAVNWRNEAFYRHEIAVHLIKSLR